MACVRFVGAPFEDGQNLTGTLLAPTALRDAGFKAVVEKLGWKLSDAGDLGDSSEAKARTIALFRAWCKSGTKQSYSEWAKVEIRSEDSIHVHSHQGLSDDVYATVKNAETIGANCHLIHKECLQASANGQFALTIGGDHSVAAGSISALMETYPDLAVVWVDAHGDANTPETSPSNHYHGMPAAHLMGWFKRTIPGFEWLKTVLPESRLAFIGLRDIDPEEGEMLRQSDVTVYTMHDVTKLGIAKVLENALRKVDPEGTRPLHLSFDIDSIEPHDAPGTGTLARGGLSLREANFICTQMSKSTRLVGMDLVEVNPLVDDLSEAMHGDDIDLAPTTVTTHVALELILAALGKTSLHSPVPRFELGPELSLKFQRQLSSPSKTTAADDQSPSSLSGSATPNSSVEEGVSGKLDSAARKQLVLHKLGQYLPPFAARQVLEDLETIEQFQPHLVREAPYVSVPGLRNRSFLSIDDVTGEELSGLLNLAVQMKSVHKNTSRMTFQPLLGKSVAMIFQKRSTRTRVSTETGMAMLGGHALFLGPSDIQLGANETIKDTALVLSRMNSLLFARVYAHSDVVELAQESSIPVINGLSDLHHPLQTLADLQTLQEHFGAVAGLTVSWVGDGNNVLHDLMLGCAKLGAHLQIATPKGYEPNHAVLARTMELASESGTRVEISTDPVNAVSGAHAVFTDTWISMGQENQKSQKLIEFAGYQVTMELMSNADPSAVFMHCLPRKPEEVSDDVFYSPCSLVFQEAENRMWTVMAVMLSLLK